MAIVDSRKTNTRPKFIRPIIIIAVIGLGGFFVYRSLNKPQPTGVIIASGSIEADEATVSPKVAGKVLILSVDEGDNVHRGELLARLDDTELRAQLGQAQASLVSAQAKLD
jgi:HlyD family secretion protein